MVPPPRGTDVWAWLWGPRVARDEANIEFQLLHNLPARDHLARLWVEAAAHCPRCPGVVEDLLHVFARCPRAAATWQHLVAALLAFTGPQQDKEILFLAWPVASRDLDIATAVIVFAHLVWTTMGEARPPAFKRLRAALRAKPAPFTALL